MMIRWGLWLAGAFALASPAHAEQIHKCTGPDGIAYQNLPCAAGQQEQRLASSIASVDQPREANVGIRPRQLPQDSAPRVVPDRRDIGAGARSQQANRYAGTPFSATTLFIGMTDTQVLNLPAWGRPVRISRSRGSQGWREEWVYRNASDEMSLLYFRNGRLVEREEAPVATLQASASTD
jgi:hypothetical protein